MDTNATIAKVIKQYLSGLLGEWDDYNASQQPDYLRHSTIFDDDSGRYQLLRYGWHQGKYVYNVSIHIDVIDDKVWIQRNTTEEEIVDVLAEHNIGAAQIVLGFVDPEMRKLYAYSAG